MSYTHNIFFIITYDEVLNTRERTLYCAVLHKIHEVYPDKVKRKKFTGCYFKVCTFHINEGYKDVSVVLLSSTGRKCKVSSFC